MEQEKRKPRIVALLPMKAHSERVKNKNFRTFCGKPLFKWILETLLSIEEISEIVINTDARNLLLEHGLKESGKVRIRDRKPEICGDFVSMNTIIADDVANVPADCYIMTHTTNPMLRADTIKDAVNTYISHFGGGTCDSLFTVNKFQSRFYRVDGSPVNHDPGKLIRTQDLEPLFEENSNLYIFTSQSFKNTAARIGAKPMMYPMSFPESLDIDDMSGWELAETVKKLK
jgi:CMP-N-acetylneuraminic acid synthetase